MIDEQSQLTMAGSNNLPHNIAHDCDLYGSNDNWTSPCDEDEIAIDWSPAFSRLPWIDFGALQQKTTTQMDVSLVQHYDIAHPSNFSRTPSNATVEYVIDSSLSMQHCKRAATLPTYGLTDPTGQRQYKDSKDAHGIARRKTQNRSAYV